MKNNNNNNVMSSGAHCTVVGVRLRLVLPAFLPYTYRSTLAFTHTRFTHCRTGSCGWTTGFTVVVGCLVLRFPTRLHLPRCVYLAFWLLLLVEPTLHYGSSSGLPLRVTYRVATGFLFHRDTVTVVPPLVAYYVLTGSAITVPVYLVPAITYTTHTPCVLRFTVIAPGGHVLHIHTAFCLFTAVHYGSLHFTPRTVPHTYGWTAGSAPRYGLLVGYTAAAPFYLRFLFGYGHYHNLHSSPRWFVCPAGSGYYTLHFPRSLRITQFYTRTLRLHAFGYAFWLPFSHALCTPCHFSYPPRLRFRCGYAYVHGCLRFAHALQLRLPVGYPVPTQFVTPTTHYTPPFYYTRGR